MTQIRDLMPECFVHILVEVAHQTRGIERGSTRLHHSAFGAYELARPSLPQSTPFISMLVDARRRNQRLSTRLTEEGDSTAVAVCR